ncbi:transposase [Microcystis aeruginosa]|jgi:REP element-mobilizing transposase RayT|uniref:Transposase n=2 Tax=Microcystis TaxID=1125 RepID=A0A552HXT6_MICVR|nr:transposase [Microcystis aeruginosa]TRU74480.1 MAG: transposase [Microcystis viridis Mv_BB_P_19951000_S69]TRU76027.1 MAG: transposase [Microcystis viridis Mv_BB_P_19951000_S68D]TRU77271.1 MAG: transposase [Microcystis viridis Mv_BB_P_19951000_S68]TRU86890.1 MAG: transposase [Microcystis viridis Mv_BB_P_19951000_S69D]QGZ90374.1 transposase [Microcystis aeruginosa FD4]
MPYRHNTFEVGQYYHIYNRGNNRQDIFFERENYLFFLRLVRKYLLETLDVIAYCLMPNHYHLLIRLKKAELSAAMQAFSLSYTKAMNQRYGRVGSLFQGRFQAILVNDTEYLLNLSRYIHCNPVKARLVSQPQEWEFSSFREYVGWREGTLPNLEIIVATLGSMAACRSFMMMDIDVISPELKGLLLDE